MKSETEFLVVNFLTGFSVCFYFSTSPILLNSVLNDTAQMMKNGFAVGIAGCCEQRVVAAATHTLC